MSFYLYSACQLFTFAPELLYMLWMFMTLNKADKANTLHFRIILISVFVNHKKNRDHLLY